MAEAGVVRLAVALASGPVASSSGAAARGAALVDRDLVRELQRGGNEDLYGSLVQRHKQRVLRVAAAVLGPGYEAEAEDVAQEAFLAGFRKLASFRGDCSFATWITRLARNLAIDRTRCAAHRRVHLPATALEARPCDHVAAQPEAMAMAEQRRRLVLATLEQLPSRQRMIVYLYYWIGCPVAEIADLLELEAGAVKSHLHRSRRRLAAALEQVRCDD